MADKKYETKEKLTSYYASRVEALSAVIARLKSKNRAYVAAELLTFGLAVASAVLYCADGFLTAPLVAAVAMLAAYALVRRADVRNGRRIDANERLRSVYGKELKYMSGDYACFDDGSRYADPHHAFAFDMDVFGHDSLYNRVSRAVTTGGADVLASWLGSLLPGRAEVGRRREAVDELAGMEEWRAAFLAEGQGLRKSCADGGGTIDSGAILTAVNEVVAMDISPVASRPYALVAAWAAIVCFAALIVMAVAGVVPAAAALLWGVAQMFVVIGLNSRSIRKISRAAEKLHAHLRAYISLIRHIDGARFESAELKQLQAPLAEGGHGALESFGRLSDILDSLDRRSNIGLVLFNMFALSDFFLVRRFLLWQGAYMESIGRWVDCVSRIDALVSMGTFRFNEPRAVEAEVTDDDVIVYDAKGLYMLNTEMAARVYSAPSLVL